MEKSWDITFLKVASLMAEHSKCAKYHVGAVIVKDKRILGCGYNGTPSGMQNCCDHFKGQDMTDPLIREEHHKFSVRYEIHAEANAIGFSAKNGVQLGSGCTLYCTLEPCPDCARLIVASGIDRVVYGKEYDRTHDGTDFLKRAGVKVELLDGTKCSN